MYLSEERLMHDSVQQQSNKVQKTNILLDYRWRQKQISMPGKQQNEMKSGLMFMCHFLNEYINDFVGL